MALPLWDQLQKSQDDPETIEEAIERIVAAHNDDPDAHLEGDRSLEQHKADGVIDHPEFSVVRDKVGAGELDLRWFTFDRLILFSNMGEQGAWDSAALGDGDVLFTPGQTEMRSGSTDGNATAIQSDPGLKRWINFDEDFLWQSSLYIANSSNISATFGFCAAQIFSGNFDGVFFRFEDGQMYAGYSINDGSETLEPVSTPTIGGLDFHTYRIEYIADNDLLTYYIDGVQVHSVSSPPTSLYGTALSSWQVRSLEDSFKRIWVSDMQMSVAR